MNQVYLYFSRDNFGELILLATSHFQKKYLKPRKQHLHVLVDLVIDYESFSGRFRLFPAVSDTPLSPLSLDFCSADRFLSSNPDELERFDFLFVDCINFSAASFLS
mmetsp:Transcript_29581/g.44821  ORF Transcript_29581/g.44821 Transcript_29581/m.44821 type:complete len:106 (+) Transcript_29581:1611-1928(+)